jgi:hypothetical protein
MRSRLPVLLLLAAVVFSPAALAAAPKEEAPRSRRGELWKVPIYFTLGPFRDALDVPFKGLSSVPVVNRIFFAPLLIFNTFTSATTWSLTDEGMEGGTEAWMACEKMKRKRTSRRRAPEAVVTRPWSSCYLPNIQSGVRILANQPRPDFTRSEPAAPPPASAPASPKGSPRTK